MRIAYVLTSAGVGGAERQVLGLARRMAARGHAVKVIVLLPQGASDLFPHSASGLFEVTYLGIRKRPVSVAKGLARGAMALRGFRPDVIHSHNFHGNMVARLLGALFARVPVISTIHNVYEGGWVRMVAYRLTDFFSRRTLAVSQAARDRYVKLRAVAERKAGVIANGIETGIFAPDVSCRAGTRAAVDAGDEFAWIATGRLAEAKDYPNLLRAFAMARGAVASCLLWVAGAGTPEYAESLKTLADSLGLRDAVRWLGQRNDLPALLDAADGFVLSSAWEGMPLAAGEAMAMGKPVVATDVGGVRELVGDAGLLVSSGDAAALAEAMLRVMRMGSDERAAMGEAGRVRILEQFAMDAKADEWERMYLSVAGD